MIGDHLEFSSKDYQELEEQKGGHVEINGNNPSRFPKITWQMVTIVALACLSLLMFCALLFGSESSATTIKNPTIVHHEKFSFLQITDIHMDPFYDESVSCSKFCRNVETNSNNWLCSEKTDAPFKAPLSRFSCDPSPDLLQTALDTATGKTDPIFVAMTGDMGAHAICGTKEGPLSSCKSMNQPHQILFDTVTKGVEMIHLAFPDIPIFPILGNDDVPVHYVTPLGDDLTWLKDLQIVWEPLITCKHCSDDTKKILGEVKADMTHWLDGAFYSVELPGLAWDIYALNTLLYSGKSRRTEECGGPAAQSNAADTQMEYLKKGLEKTRQRGRKAFIMGHIPPAMQPYDDTLQWIAKYIPQYTDIVTKQHDIIAGQIYGHYHYDMFQVLSVESQNLISSEQHNILSSNIPKSQDQEYATETSKIPKRELSTSFGVLRPSIDEDSIGLMVAPGMSSSLLNNPAFREYRVNKDGDVYDYDQYYLDLIGNDMVNKMKEKNESKDATTSIPWKIEYTFTNVHPAGCAKNELAKYMEHIITDASAFNEYQAHRMVDMSPYRVHYYCASLYQDMTDFNKCIKDWGAYQMDDRCYPSE